jgi:alpha-tubulin suppressor-like RCC1 family protein
VYSWGSGAHGALGHGDEQDANAPRLISALASAKATQVACGPEHSLVLTEDNTLYTFGCVPVRVGTSFVPVATRNCSAHCVCCVSCAQKGQLGHVEDALAKALWVVEDVAGLGVIRAITAAAGFLSSPPFRACARALWGAPRGSPRLAVAAVACRQSAVLFESGRVMGLGNSELKRKNWLVPTQLVAGEGSVFLVC